MAGTSWPMLPLTNQQRQLSFNIMYNMPTINYTQPKQRVPKFPHPIVAFIVPVVLNMIEIKCQCKGDSPFDTNPTTMWFTLSCLMAYCLAYGAELGRIQAPDDLVLLRRGSALFASLSLVSLTSILFPSAKLFLYGFCGLMSIGDVAKTFKLAWEWIDGRILRRFWKLSRGQRVETNILRV